MATSVRQLPLAAYTGRLERGADRLEAGFLDYRVQSAFQPIFSFAHGRPVGFEGLARARDASGAPVPPPELLAADRSPAGTIFLDRLLRTLHAANFVDLGFPDAWLFLNVAPSVVVSGRTQGPFFREMLASYGIPPERVVVEITESESSDEGSLEEAARYYKEIGCLIAIDDFGAGHSNFQRIWRLKPDLVKLDRLMVSQAVVDPAARRGLLGVAALLHEVGALVVAEGVETEAETLAALHAEVDLLQGYFLQRPFTGPAPDFALAARFDALRHSFARQVRDDESDAGAALLPYLEAFERAVARLAAGESSCAAAGSLFAMSRLVRCYLLGADGAQIGENATAPGHVATRDPRHRPLEAATGAHWTHRHYFRRALANPARTQVSRPYLSLTDPRMCLTLSRAVRRADGATVVFCCDLAYPLA